MSYSTSLKAAFLQIVIVAVAFGILRLTLDKEFFEDWGWLTGPVAWLGSATIVAVVLTLPIPQTLMGAALAGLVSAVFVVIGLHLVGLVLAIPLFALWCGRLRVDPELPAETI